MLGIFHRAFAFYKHAKVPWDAHFTHFLSWTRSKWRNILSLRYFEGDRGVGNSVCRMQGD